MDISQIDDINLLKSLAYDQIIAVEVAQANLRMLQTRMLALTETPDPV